MLRGTEAARARQRRPLPSLKQRYHEYVMQRVETYKNSLGRARILELGGEAAAEMQDAFEGQFLLTEVLMQEAVDRMIVRHLKLPPFSRWKQQYAKVRRAQREPTHWRLEPDCALTALLPRLEPEDQVLVVGSGMESAAYLLAAYDTIVTFIASDMGAVERVESGLANEALASTAECYLVQPGCWMPPFGAPLDLVVIDTSSLGEVDPPTRAIFLSQLQAVTAPAGLHVLMPGASGLAPEALLMAYEGWARDQMERSRRRGSARRAGIVLTSPHPAQAEQSLQS